MITMRRALLSSSFVGALSSTTTLLCQAFVHPSSTIIRQHASSWGRRSLSSSSSLLRAVSVDVDDNNSQLAQLASMTTLSIDSGDLKVIQDFANTGYITDATTNPLFVSQAGLSGDPLYAQMVDSAVEYAQNQGLSNEQSETIALAIDRLAVNLGKAISEIVPGYISTEVDPRLSFNVDASIQRGRRISKMYQDLGVGKERVLIKLAATWEGIMAAHELEKEGIQCNLTLIFSVVQAMACAQYGAHLISPFPGRILDWNNAKLGRPDGVQDPSLDEGVIACREMYNYFKANDYDTICMPASWRPSRGTSDPDYLLDEIRALAGTDRMTIPAPLLEKLAASTEPLKRQLDASKVEKAATRDSPMTEEEFRFQLNMDGCGTDKLAEGIRAFVGETEKLEKVITDKVKAAKLV